MQAQQDLPAPEPAIPTSPSAAVRRARLALAAAGCVVLLRRGVEGAARRAAAELRLARGLAARRHPPQRRRRRTRASIVLRALSQRAFRRLPERGARLAEGRVRRRGRPGAGRRPRDLGPAPRHGEPDRPARRLRRPARSRPRGRRGPEPPGRRRHRGAPAASTRGRADAPHRAAPPQISFARSPGAGQAAPRELARPGSSGTSRSRRPSTSPARSVDLTLTGIVGAAHRPAARARDAALQPAVRRGRADHVRGLARPSGGSGTGRRSSPPGLVAALGGTVSARGHRARLVRAVLRSAPRSSAPRTRARATTATSPPTPTPTPGPAQSAPSSPVGWSPRWPGRSWPPGVRNLTPTPFVASYLLVAVLGLGAALWNTPPPRPRRGRTGPGRTGTAAAADPRPYGVLWRQPVLLLGTASAVVAALTMLALMTAGPILGLTAGPYAGAGGAGDPAAPGRACSRRASWCRASSAGSASAGSPRSAAR